MDNISNGNVFAQDVVDRGPGLIYDRLTTAAGSSTSNVYNFFSTPIGGTKTKSDTNLVQGNRLPPPQAFSVQSLGFFFGPNMTLVDLVGFLKNYYFEFKIGQKIFCEGPMQCFPAGAGIDGFASTNSATAGILAAVSNGSQSLMSTRRFPDYPRIIPANVYFGLDVKQGAAAVTLVASIATVAGIGAPAYGGLDCMAILDGIWDREVQ